MRHNLSQRLYRWLVRAILYIAAGLVLIALGFPLFVRYYRVPHSYRVETCVAWVEMANAASVAYRASHKGQNAPTLAVLSAFASSEGMNASNWESTHFEIKECEYDPTVFRHGAMLACYRVIDNPAIVVWATGDGHVFKGRMRSFHLVWPVYERVGDRWLPRSARTLPGPRADS